MKNNKNIKSTEYFFIKVGYSAVIDEIEKNKSRLESACINARKNGLFKKDQKLQDQTNIYNFLIHPYKYQENTDTEVIEYLISLEKEMDKFVEDRVLEEYTKFYPNVSKDKAEKWWENVKKSTGRGEEDPLVFMVADSIEGLSWARRIGANFKARDKNGKSLLEKMVSQKDWNSKSLSWMYYTLKADGYEKQSKSAIKKFVAGLPRLIVYSPGVARDFCDLIEKNQIKELTGDFERRRQKTQINEGVRKKTIMVSTFTLNTSLWSSLIGAKKLKNESLVNYIEEWLEDWQERNGFSKMEKEWFGNLWESQTSQTREVLYSSKMRFENTLLKNSMLKGTDVQKKKAKKSI
jgi:hypothetical protein